MNRLLVPTLALLAVGCSSGSTPSGDAAVLFPPSFRETGYRRVRPCRSPGEHSALFGFTVWVDEPSAARYDQILSGGGDAGVQEMPAGAVVIKEVFSDLDCRSVERWVAMKKMPGYDPAHGDWFWQELTVKGVSKSEGRVAACIACHLGGDTGSCAGFGALKGMDYLCTAP